MAVAQKAEKMLLKLIKNLWLCNMQFFPKVWIIEISKKAFRISVSGSFSFWQFLDNRIRLQTHYPAGYPTGKPDGDHLCTGIPNLGYLYPWECIFLSEGVHLRLAIESKNIFTCCLFSNICTSVRSFGSNVLYWKRYLWHCWDIFSSPAVISRPPP